MKETIIKLVKKYPFTILSIIALAVVMVQILEYGDIFETTKETIMVSEIAIALSSVITGSFMFDKILDCYNEKIPEVVKNKPFLINIICCISSFIIYMLLRIIPNPELKAGDNFLYNYIAIMFSLIAYYFIIKKKDMELPQYAAKIFMNSLILFLFECVIAAGISVLYYIYYILFKDVDFVIYARIMFFQFVVVSYIGFMIAAEKVDGKLNLFSKVLIKYVMLIMVLIGFVFFYIYLFRIIISREIPSNQVFTVCLLLFVVGLTTALMARGFEEKREQVETAEKIETVEREENNITISKESFYDKIIKYLPVAFIPALILQIISLVLRVGQYGLTISRYYGVIAIIFEIIYIAIYLFKYEKLKNILLVQALLILIITVVPFVNAYQLPSFLT